MKLHKKPATLAIHSMIAHLTGTILDIRDHSLVITTGGIGYEVGVIDTLLGHIKIGDMATLWIASVTRDTGTELFGFTHYNEYLLFKKLTGVSGVGPRSGLAILSMIPTNHLIESIRNKDASLLVRVSGVGKKTAEKVVIELSDKLEHLREGDDTTSPDTDVVDALLVLGYASGDIRKALQEISHENASTQDKIREALRILSNS